MKQVHLITTVCIALLLGAGSSRASNIDFSGNNNNNGGNYSGSYQSDNSNNNGNDNHGGNGNDNNYGGNNNGNNNYGDNDPYSGNGNNGGNGGNGKNNKDDYKSGGYSLPASYSWSSNGDWDKNKDKDGKGNVPPPECAPGDPGHGKDGNWNGGKGGDGDNGKFDRHYVNYYKDLCDKDKHDHDPGKRHCDPGNPAPLPGSLSMFAAGLLLLGIRKKFFAPAAK